MYHPYLTDSEYFTSKREMESHWSDDEPTIVSFGFPRWGGDYVFEDRNEAVEFCNLWDGEII